MAVGNNMSGMERAGILSLALCIDLLQPMMLAFMPMIFAASTGWVGLVPVVGQALAAGAAVAGVAFSFILDLFLTLLGFIFVGGWLWVRGIPPGWRLGAAGAMEMVPVLNYLPSLTLGTYLAMNAANDNGKGGLLTAAASFLPVGRAATLALGAKGASSGGAAAQAAKMRTAASESQMLQNALQAQSENDQEPRQTSERAPRVGMDIREPRYTDSPKERLAA